MKWNNSLAAASTLLLSACGGGGYSNYGLEAAPPAAGSLAAQSWSGDRDAGPPPRSRPAPRQYAPQQAEPQWQPEPAAETWRAADGSIRTRAPSPQHAPDDTAPEPAYAAPEPAAYVPPEPAPVSAAPGAGYAIPGTAPASYAPPPAAPQDLAGDPTAGMEGPRGSSQAGAGERRYDEIGYAGVRGVGDGAPDTAVVAAHRSLPANSYVEVTALDTGRTILVLVTGTMEPGADHPIDLSGAAARQLGHGEGESIPVRIRTVTPAPQEAMLLRSGQAAAPRADAPAVLLSALRKRLPGAPSYAAAAPVRPAPHPAAAPAYARPAPARAPVRGGFVVQVAALSNAGNAQALAKSMGGFVKQGGGLHRVQLGPFATRAEADSARAGAARAGYGDARVIAAN